MKMNRVHYVLAFTVPALVSLTLALAASGGTSETAADFPAVVAFELGEAEFLPGDSITIQQVRGTSSTIGTGETYCVEGTYTLASRDKADLALFATTVSDVPTPTDPSQHTRIEKGTGKFRLVKTMRQEGYLHVSFYPVPSGSGFGGVYFGQGKWVLHHKGWSDLHPETQAQVHAATGSSTGVPVSLTGPNRALLEYLGDPVQTPANLDAAYGKDGLIEAIQAAARKAGISVRQVEIEDSEFPFLVGVICKEGEFSKLTEQLRKMADYEYNGCTSTPTHSAFNMVPYRVFPSQVSERISHRTGLRSQIFLNKLLRLE
jgi:hypothetical protein